MVGSLSSESEDLVHCFRDGLLERRAVGLEEQVLVDVEAGEADADQFEKVGDQGKAVDGFQHAVRGDEADEAVDAQGNHGGLVIGFFPLLGHRGRYFLELLVQVFGGGVRADGRAANRGAGGHDGGLQRRGAAEERLGGGLGGAHRGLGGDGDAGSGVRESGHCGKCRAERGTRLIMIIERSGGQREVRKGKRCWRRDVEGTSRAPLVT